MMSLKDSVTYELVTGEPTTVDDTTITPETRVLSVRWPNGGWVWNRPVAVVVEQEGQIERLPIVDVTRVAQISLYGFSLFIALLTLIASLGLRRKR
jgi:hypothetical protein